MKCVQGTQKISKDSQNHLFRECLGIGLCHDIAQYTTFTVFCDNHTLNNTIRIEHI